MIAANLPANRCAIVFVDIPKLREDFRPVLRVGAAIKRGALAGGHLGHMAAGFHRPAIVREDQRNIAGIVDGVQQVGQADVQSQKGLVERVHFGYL